MYRTIRALLISHLSNRERERQTDRQTGRERDRERERERERERQTDRSKRPGGWCSELNWISLK